MALARSRITAQGQISVPADVRRKLGVGPGSVLEWEDKDGEMTIRRVGRFTSADIHEAIFGKNAPAMRTVEEMKQGIARHMRDRHARR